MTVADLIAALETMPSDAVVLFEGDAGYSLISGLQIQHNGGGLPHEVILLPSLDGD